jgi:acyl-CoA synthetase (NDP forming)
MNLSMPSGINGKKTRMPATKNKGSKMYKQINFNRITELFETADSQGRNFLFEDEVYNLLFHSGSETPPKCNLITRGAMPSPEELMSIPGDRAVLKIVSPFIIHKTEVGGVRVVDKYPDKIRSAIRRMLYEVPENQAAHIEQHPSQCPPVYEGLGGADLIAAISRDLVGVLQVQFMPPDSGAFGNELIVGLRCTREFGTIISAGLGGTDTELYAQRFRKGQAIVAASTELVDGRKFFELFQNTISYKKLTGLTRGQRRIVTDEQLIECFDSFIHMARHYSPANPNGPFVIEELEINPFAFTDYMMIPLDGMCRISRPSKVINPRPVTKIHALLHPETIGLIGVSTRRKNFGRNIMDNILAQGFSKENLIILRDGTDQIDGVRCVPNLGALDKKLDLFVVAVGAAQVPDLVEEVIELDAANSVMLIPGGMGETEDSKVRAEKVIASIDKAHAADGGGPVFLGANCMGVVSLPGRYDTWFIPEKKFPKKTGDSFHRAAFISQSGAFMLHRSSQCPELSPAYMISMGNQTDLTLGDMVSYFVGSDAVDVIAVYAEGFGDMDGLAFCRQVRQAVLAGKEVIFYKAGRTPEGKTATSSHTASLAGDYMVCENCVRQAGAIVARTVTEFQDLFALAENLHSKKIAGNRLAAVSGAGFETVAMADSIQSDDYTMTLAGFQPDSLSQMGGILEDKRLTSLVSLGNPLDINPGADDETHAAMAKILLQDPGVDAVVIGLDPLSPAMSTLDDREDEKFSMYKDQAIAQRLSRVVEEAQKPVVAIVDGGKLYEPLRNLLMKNRIPVFSVCDRAVAALSLYMEGRLRNMNILEQAE